MAKRKFQIDQLIINSPYEEPSTYWRYDRATRMFERVEGARRPAGYVVATPGSKAFDDPGMFVELPLVNQIRPRVKAWREGGYAGVSGITKRLLEHWRDPEERRDRRFFFCQLEAIETLIWLTEASPAKRQGVDVPGDGGEFQRRCAKMATGSGKTIVMAMLIAWQVLNKVTYPQDKRFSKHIFVVAPGLTVKSRLQVLVPDNPGGTYYDEFNILPPGLVEKLRQGQILVRNWHVLNWETDEQIAKKRSVDRRGAKSDEAYVREVLGEMAGARNIVVINDEAHHAWRVPAESKVAGVSKDDIEEATRWVGGLDRIHRSRGILTCFDFSATPFAPSGKKAYEEALFGWIVSDFGLNDAIESGLVKTPRVVVRDDGMPDVKTYKSKLYHIYMDETVKDDLNRKAEEHEPLPDLVSNGYYLLGKDWLETSQKWRETGHNVPPVMISVANRVETAARIKYAFDHGRIRIDELARPELTLHIDSKVLESAEAQEEATSLAFNGGESDDGGGDDDGRPRRKLTKQQQAELLRQMVDTVGQEGRPGAAIQNVISVGMLSEGWDAKTVTHIMGLRAFSSQLLCEQVVGRGLRRTSYDVNDDTGLFDAEYVNIFGVPFTFLPHEGGDGPPPPPPTPKTKIEPVAAKRQFEISWPNIIRIDHVYRPRLHLDLEKVQQLEIRAADIATVAELAPVVDGKPDITRLSEIDLEALGRKFRLQKVVFETSRDTFDQMRPAWKGSKEYLLAQLFGLVERVITSDRIVVTPTLFNQDDVRRRIIITLSMTKVVQHIWEAIRCENTESLEPVFDSEHPIRSTGDMRPWYTGKPCEVTRRSHISHCVYDSTWEATEAFELERSEHVEAWVKNDHLGFEVAYVFKGVIHKFRPDFLVRLATGDMLILEVKGQDTQKDKAKRRFLDEWVTAVNNHGAFGRWASDVSREPRNVAQILASASGRAPAPRA
jgi:type III restriction enzyme